MPTRFIDREEFTELMHLEGDSFPLYKLVAIPFGPPTPEGVPDPPEAKTFPTVRILMLNVAEPRLYRDENGIVFVVLPSFDVVTYDIASDAHPVHGEWCYRFSPYNYDGKSDISDAAFLFNEAAVPTFELEDFTTH